MGISNKGEKKMKKKKKEKRKKIKRTLAFCLLVKMEGEYNDGSNCLAHQGTCKFGGMLHCVV